MKYALLSGATALALAVCGAAQAAQVLVYGPTVSVNASVTGPSAGVHIVNGHIVNSGTSPGASVSAGPETPGATSVWAEAVGAYADPDKSWTIATSGRSSLDEGWLKGGVAAGGDTSFGYPRGQLTTSLADTIWFDNTSGAPVELTLGLAYDGQILNPHGDGSPGGSVGFQLYGSCGGGCGNDAGEYIRFATGAHDYASGYLRAYFNGAGSYGYNDYGSPVPLGASDKWYVGRGASDGVGGAVDGLLQTTLLIPTGQTSLGLYADLDLDCASGSSCLFGDTTRFAFGELPTGLNWTSASGAFLSGGPSAAPEPGAWVLMLAGFSLAGVAARARRAASA